MRGNLRAVYILLGLLVAETSDRQWERLRTEKLEEGKMWEEEMCVQTDPLSYVTSASFCTSWGNFQFVTLTLLTHWHYWHTDTTDTLTLLTLLTHWHADTLTLLTHRHWRYWNTDTPRPWHYWQYWHTETLTLMTHRHTDTLTLLTRWHYLHTDTPTHWHYWHTETLTLLTHWHTETLTLLTILTYRDIDTTDTLTLLTHWHTDTTYTQTHWHTDVVTLLTHRDPHTTDTPALLTHWPTDNTDCQHCCVTCRWSGHLHKLKHLAEIITICFPVITVHVVCKYWIRFACNLQYAAIFIWRALSYANTLFWVTCIN